jgi:hypothetical protein
MPCRKQSLAVIGNYKQTNSMGIFHKLFGKPTTKLIPGQTLEPKKLPTIDEFVQLSPADRMSLIMVLGDSGKLEYFPFIKHAVLSDTDQNVKFAALKRIHLFKDHSETIAILTDLKNNGGGKTFEPYFSMALSRLGLISIEEFEKMINNS